LFCAQALLAESSQTLLKQLKKIFSLAIRFCRVQDQLYTSAEVEVHRRKSTAHEIDERTAQVKGLVALQTTIVVSNSARSQGRWGTHDSAADSSAIPIGDVAHKIGREIDTIQAEYDQLFQDMLHMLHSQHLRCVSAPSALFSVDKLISGFAGTKI
jgi:hypothetical protein